MKKNHVQLSPKDEEQLLKMLKKGSLKSRTFKRITALLELNRGKTYQAVREVVDLSTVSLSKLSSKYATEGLNCLYDAPRSGRPVETTAELRDKITLLACEEPPKGHSQWSLRLLADKVVELGYCEKISYVQVDKILKKKNQAAPD